MRYLIDCLGGRVWSTFLAQRPLRVISLSWFWTRLTDLVFFSENLFQAVLQLLFLMILLMTVHFSSTLKRAIFFSNPFPLTLELSSAQEWSFGTSYSLISVEDFESTHYFPEKSYYCSLGSHWIFIFSFKEQYDSNYWWASSAVINSWNSSFVHLIAYGI